MFKYFGSKARLVDCYDKPQYDSIVEPFCGSARYACRYFDRDVWINDAYPVVYEIWLWIQQASKKDIRSLPEPGFHQKIDEYTQLSQEEKNLIGLCVSANPARPNKTVPRWSAKGGPDNNKYSWITPLKTRLLKLQGRINHWKITCLSYAEIPNYSATWYVDPPYQKMGKHYVHGPNKIDFGHLGNWCRERKGQVIVCEGTGADWLPFKPLKSNLRRLERTDQYQELVWTQSDRKSGFGLI